MLKEPSAGTSKAQEDVSPAMAPVNQIPVRFLRVYPKPGKNTGKASTVPASHLSKRLSAANSDPKQLKGRDDTDFHAQQKALLGANLQLLNVRDTLVRFGLGVRGSFVPQISIQKGKEKVGLEGQPNAYLHNKKKGKKLLKYRRRKPGWATGASGLLKGILGSLPEKAHMSPPVAGQSSSPELALLSSSAHLESTQPSPEVKKAPEEFLVSTQAPETLSPAMIGQISPEFAAHSSSKKAQKSSAVDDCQSLPNRRRRSIRSQPSPCRRL